ncbi:helix-turn-helix domain-containing protein, partial [Streptomyces sp. NPDC003483]
MPAPPGQPAAPQGPLAAPPGPPGLARGLDVLRCFRPGSDAMSLSEIAGATGLAR